MVERKLGQAGLRGGDVFGIGGAAGTGKSSLMYFLALITIAPTSVGPVPIGGKASQLVWFDMDGRFELVRLRQLLWHHLQKCLLLYQQQQQPELVLDFNLDQIMKQSLSRFYRVPRCTSVTSFLQRLKELQTWLEELPLVKLPKLFILDGIYGFPESEEDSDLTMVYSTLSQLIDEFGVVVFYTLFISSPLPSSSANTTANPSSKGWWSGLKRPTIYFWSERLATEESNMLKKRGSSSLIIKPQKRFSFSLVSHAASTGCTPDDYFLLEVTEDGIYDVTGNI